MTQAVLLTVPGATDGTTQWRAESLQMVNWGGFQGHVTVPFAHGATLLSGASGTGKSTLLDAYLAVMMPSDTPFNGASNDATVGRARSGTQRNLLTYLRGKTDTNRESSTNEIRDRVLRGADTATWGAVAMTFIDDNGKRFTAGRVYIVPRAATHTGDVGTRMITIEARLDLRDLEPLRASGFDKRTLENRWPSLTVHPSYTNFSQRLFDRLGIGANGDGIKALRLLARIQGGYQIPSVDGLYKSMVLERPSTYAAADRAVEHFRSLEDTYAEMVTAAEKSKHLARLPELWNERLDALATEQLIDTFGVTRTGTTPFMRWQLNTEARLLDKAVDTNRAQRREAAAKFDTARTSAGQLRLSIEETKEDQRQNGGGQLDRIKAEIVLQQDRQVTVNNRRLLFDERVAPLLLNVGTEEQLFEAQLAAEDFVADFEQAEDDLESRARAIAIEGYPLPVRRQEIDDELKQLRGRRSLVRGSLHESRMKMAAAAGLTETDLPFVAELIDLAPDQQQWRTAAEAALVGVARILLVDAAHHERLSAAVEHVEMRRVNFTGVDPTDHTDCYGRDGYISGKLVFKDSPFSLWVQQRLTQNNTDALCVNGPDQLRGHDLRITRSGQTRKGRDSAHGKLETSHIIGFNNADLIASLEAERGEIDDQIAELVGREKKVRDQLAALRKQKAAHQLVLDTEWEAIDAVGIEAAIADLRAEHSRILATSDRLPELAATLERLEADLISAESEMTRTFDRKDALDEAHAAWCDRQDAVTRHLKQHDADGVTLDDKQSEYLDLVYARVSDANSLEALTAGVKRLGSQLAQDTQKERQRAAAATKTLTGIFEAYQRNEQWNDPNRGISIEDYPSYRDELDQLTADRLHTLRDEWRRRLAQWSGQDLLPLHSAFDTAIEDIEDRLTPVNAILAELPFGPQRDRLTIVLRRLSPDDVVTFRRELKLLSSGITDELTDEQAEARFRRLRKFIALIRKPEGGTRPVVNRDVYLDVRRHVEITAEGIHAAGGPPALYAYLGDKSGGETQELVAFIVGAALRYQLGDEDRARPRFAPIFLDEGFVKSDSEFAGRAVAAWKGLGFQLIVGAPLDKVTALEPAMDLMLSITKSSRGYSHIHELRPTDSA